ncbi:hypothetical protein Clacol_007753 [Clathrus columnatus]|uniref:Uncharacterized protein n=1 Tax=Clathrus columnatus TaxID=1419009 RepID=A0AAV5AFT0_9AGAM|nr:hypothetical protein Clacol_007753 [Clathrus columnatus]
MSNGETDMSISPTHSATTINLPHGYPTRYSDFANLRIDAIDDENILESSEVKLLLEVKPSISSHLVNLDNDDPGVAKALDLWMQVAHSSVLGQAAVISARYHHIYVIPCILASGDRWQYANIKRENIPKEIYEDVHLGEYYPGNYIMPTWHPPTPVDAEKLFL